MILFCVMVWPVKCIMKLIFLDIFASCKMVPTFLLFILLCLPVLLSMPLPHPSFSFSLNCVLLLSSSCFQSVLRFFSTTALLERNFFLSLYFLWKKRILMISIVLPFHSNHISYSSLQGLLHLTFFSFLCPFLLHMQATRTGEKYTEWPEK